jgi:hypothetical protein
VTPVGLARAHTLCLCRQTRGKRAAYKCMGTAEGQLRPRCKSPFNLLTCFFLQRFLQQIYTQTLPRVIIGLLPVAYRWLRSGYTEVPLKVCSLYKGPHDDHNVNHSILSESEFQTNWSFVNSLSWWLNKSAQPPTYFLRCRTTQPTPQDFPPHLRNSHLFSS